MKCNFVKQINLNTQVARILEFGILDSILRKEKGGLLIEEKICSN